MTRIQLSSLLIFFYNQAEGGTSFESGEVFKRALGLVSKTVEVSSLLDIKVKGADGPKGEAVFSAAKDIVNSTIRNNGALQLSEAGPNKGVGHAVMLDKGASGLRRVDPAGPRISDVSERVIRRGFFENTSHPDYANNKTLTLNLCFAPEVIPLREGSELNQIGKNILASSKRLTLEELRVESMIFISNVSYGLSNGRLAYGVKELEETMNQKGIPFLAKMMQIGNGSNVIIPLRAKLSSRGSLRETKRFRSLCSPFN